MGARKDPVQHFTDGKAAWRDDAGPLVRVRGIAATAFAALVAAVALGGAPWWWDLLEGSASLRWSTLLSLAALFLGLALASTLYYLRKRTLRSLAVKHCAHMLAHTIRDEHLRIWCGTDVPTLQATADLLSQRIREYSCCLLERQDIAVAIRMATRGDKGTVYRTVGRAGMGPHRVASSEDLPADVGVARLLGNGKGRKGVLIYNDLPAAARLELYWMSKNDQSFPDEIKSFIVAPVNGWDGNDNSMIGMLYITAPVQNVFRQKHTDAVGFVADAIATILTDVVLATSTSRKGFQHVLFDK